jgi:hypothetical protein
MFNLWSRRRCRRSLCGRATLWNAFANIVSIGFEYQKSWSKESVLVPPLIAFALFDLNPKRQVKAL